MKDIIEKARNGDRSAMDELYRLTSDEMKHYCRRLCGKTGSSDDLVQETYLTAFNKIEQYREDKSFKAWLHTIALHKFYNSLRSEKPLMFAEEIDDLFEDELKGPEVYAEKSELRDLLITLISEKLNEAQRMTVVMFYYDEMSVEEIAAELGCPVGTVKTRLYHSRRILKKELAKHGFTALGTTVLISSAFKYQPLSLTAASGAAAGVSSAVKKSAILKIAAAAAAVTIAGGAVIAVSRHSPDKTPSESIPVSDTEAKAVTEILPTGTAVPATKAITTTEAPPKITYSKEAVPGNEPVEYESPADFLRISIPRNYLADYCSGTLGSLHLQSPDNERLIKDINALKNEHKIYISITWSSAVLFRPDDQTGDEVLLIGLKQNDTDMASLLKKYYGEDVSIQTENDIIVGKHLEFSGATGLSGQTVIFSNSYNKNIMLLLTDRSGTRQKEYEDIISSLFLS